MHHRASSQRSVHGAAATNDKSPRQSANRLTCCVAAARGEAARGWLRRWAATTRHANRASLSVTPWSACSSSSAPAAGSPPPATDAEEADARGALPDNPGSDPLRSHASRAGTTPAASSPASGAPCSSCCTAASRAPRTADGRSSPCTSPAASCVGTSAPLAAVEALRASHGASPLSCWVAASLLPPGGVSSALGSPSSCPAAGRRTTRRTTQPPSLALTPPLPAALLPLLPLPCRRRPSPLARPSAPSWRCCCCCCSAPWTPCSSKCASHAPPSPGDDARRRGGSSRRGSSSSPGPVMDRRPAPAACRPPGSSAASPAAPGAGTSSTTPAPGEEGAGEDVGWWVCARLPVVMCRPRGEELAVLLPLLLLLLAGAASCRGCASSCC